MYSRWILPESVRKPFYCVVAALWRDLCVSGVDAVQRVAGQPPKVVEKKVNLEGVYQWGKDADRKTIDQIKLTTREHLRRLSPGQNRSPRARQIAGLYGIRLPERFTFVRPTPNKYGFPEKLYVAGLANLVVLRGR